jgi:phospholipid transport system substrate-binding protein
LLALLLGALERARCSPAIANVVKALVKTKAKPMSFRRPLSVLLVLVGLVLGGLGPARAEAAADAAGFINDLVGQAIKTLDNKQLSEQDRVNRFRTLLVEDFDMPLIARFVIGRYWAEASDQDKQQFQKLFQEYVVRAYAQRFSEYNGETVKVIGSRKASETSTLVQSHVLRPNGAPPAKVDWRVRKGDGGFKVVDVDVEGVSMVLTQREEFGSVMQRSGGVAGLNKTLEEKLASGDTSLAAPVLPKKN